jgi:hypothetical protein
MDGLPPSPPAEVRPAPATYVYAATDVRARTEREIELCDRAGSVDWLYISGALALNVGAGFLDAPVLKERSPGLRMLGPVAVGTTFGFAVGGTFLALPQCSRDWINGGTPEGERRTHWPLAISLALLAGAVAPVLQAVEIGGDNSGWSDVERSSRVVLTGVTAFGAAFLPYLLPPRTWRAAKELENLRFRYDTGLRAPVVGYGFTF